jgi:hypothetical protein
VVNFEAVRHLLAAASLALLLLCLPWSAAVIIVAIAAGSCGVVLIVLQAIVAVPALVIAARAGLGGLGAAVQGHVKLGYRWRELALGVAGFGVWLVIVLVRAGSCS